MPVVVPFETLTDLFLNLSKKYKGTDKTAFARKPTSNDDYEVITWDEAGNDVYSLASFMVENGIESGNQVALLSENRYEWTVVDLALQLIGAVNVSLYSTLPPEQCAYILQNSEAKMFFVSTGIQLKKALRVFDDCPALNQIIAFDQPKIERYLESGYVELYQQVMQQGQKMQPVHQQNIEERSHNIDPYSIATLIYTSGTTGKPKGAMLTHRNIVSNVKAAHEHIQIDNNDRCLSFLPLCHSFERTAGYYAMMAGGAEIYYAESIDTVARNMTEAHPTIVISVPRLFEKIYSIVTKSVDEGSAVKQAIFEWALKIGRKYSEGERGVVTFQKRLADKLVFDKLKKRTGGRIRFFVSGGAALSAKIARFFKSAGLNIIEGYGLTETSPIMCANRYAQEDIGTVGSVLNGVTVAIERLEDNRIISEVSGENYPTDETSETGEILCKGPNVMRGYWKNEDATQQMIDDKGWLHTGDVGRFVNGSLKITDRITHMIVNAGGKNIYPGPVEDLFKTNKWIDQIMVVGERQSFMAALIVPDFEELEEYAAEHEIKYDSLKQLINHPDIQSLFKKEVQKYRNQMASHEKIRDFRLMPVEFKVETGELTPTLKIKRSVVEEKYAHLINDIFDN